WQKGRLERIESELLSHRPRRIRRNEPRDRAFERNARRQTAHPHPASDRRSGARLVPCPLRVAERSRVRQTRRGRGVRCFPGPHVHFLLRRPIGFVPGSPETSAAEDSGLSCPPNRSQIPRPTYETTLRSQPALRALLISPRNLCVLAPRR